MPYTISLTNGATLVEVNDSLLDTTTTDLTLVGKNTSGYGDALNENFVHLLENFSNSSAPLTPLNGQLWWNTSTRKLQVYDSFIPAWKGVSSAVSSALAPAASVSGDLWWNTGNGKLNAFNGATWVEVGPPASVGNTGLSTDSINGNAVALFTVDGTIISILSRTSFTPTPAISGFTSILPGLNMATGYTLTGTASNATHLGGVIAASYLQRNVNESTTGTLTVQNSGGVIIGTGGNLTVGRQDTVGGIAGTIIQANAINQNLLLVVNENGAISNGLYITASTRNVVIPISASIGNISISNNNINSGNNAIGLFNSNTTNSITFGTFLTTGTFTLGGPSSTGVATLFPSTASQPINIGTSTTNVITIGSTLGTVQLPTGTTRVGNTRLLQGVDGNITFPSAAGTLALENRTMHIGTTPVTINRALANLELTGITSVTFPQGSGTLLQGGLATVPRTITLPDRSGTLVSTGDAGTVTNAMLAGSITNDKLSTLTTALLVSNSATTATSASIGNAIVARDGSGNFSAGTITASLNGNASTASQAASLSSTGNTLALFVNSGSNVLINSASGGTTPAMISLHRPGVYGLNVGLDTDNVFKVGGWSDGASARLQSSTTQTIAPMFSLRDDTNNRFSTGLLVLRNSSPAIYFQDTDHNSAALYCNGNLLYILRGGNDTTGMAQVNGAWPCYWNLTNNDMLAGGNIHAQGNITATGTVTATHAPPQLAGTNNTTIATTAFVQSEIGLQSLGGSQAWIAFDTVNRAQNVQHTNSTSRPITVHISQGVATSYNGVFVVYNTIGTEIFRSNFGHAGPNIGTAGSVTMIIPVNYRYLLTGCYNNRAWAELR